MPAKKNPAAIAMLFVISPLLLAGALSTMALGLLLMLIEPSFEFQRHYDPISQQLVGRTVEYGAWVKSDHDASSRPCVIDSTFFKMTLVETRSSESTGRPIISYDAGVIAYKPVSLAIGTAALILVAASPLALWRHCLKCCGTKGETTQRDAN
ncbi:MAG: hypothetical protein K1X74_11020 [Pirellulales bacterium]|nr:hypothetical protein [Pirellulales bacterium]